MITFVVIGISLIIASLLVSLLRGPGMRARRSKKVEATRRALLVVGPLMVIGALGRISRDGRANLSLDPPPSPAPTEDHELNLRSRPRFSPQPERLAPHPSRSVQRRTVVVGTSMKIISQCKRWLGLRYSWGGGSLTGPSYGIGRGSRTWGFDCSGFTRCVYYRALGIKLPRVADAQMRSEKLKPTKSPKAGDLVFMLNRSGRAYHCGVYLGRGWMYAATKTGDIIRRQRIYQSRVVYRTATA